MAVLTLGKRLNRMAITMSFTTDQEGNGSGGWMQRLQNSTVPPPPSPYTVWIQWHQPKTATRNYRHKVRPTGGAKRKEEPQRRQNTPRSADLTTRGNKTPEPESASPQTPLPSQTKHQGYLHLRETTHKSRKGTCANRCLPRW